MPTIHKTTFLSMLLLSLGLGVAVAQNGGASSGFPTPKNDFTASEQRGHGLYLRYCVGCHGVLGDGEGENAPYIDPKPRNFTLGQFKCRSTTTGTLPTHADLVDTLRRGITNSNMPSWRPLSDENREDLVAYIKMFSPRWKSDKPSEPIHIPAEPEITADRIKAGEAVFRKLE